MQYCGVEISVELGLWNSPPKKSRFKSNERCVTAAKVTLRALTHDVAAMTWSRYFERKKKQTQMLRLRYC